MASADSQPLPKFADAAWLEDATVNPKTGQPWTYNDKLICSCGAEIHVHSHGFRALAKHRETKTHQNNMQRKIKGVIREQRNSQTSSILEEARAIIATSATDAPLRVKQHDANFSNVKRDADGELKAKTSHPSSVTAKSKENAAPSSQTASSYGVKLAALRAERAKLKVELEHEADAVARASLSGHISRLRKQISDIKAKEAVETIKKQRRETMSSIIQQGSDGHSYQDGKPSEVPPSKSINSTKAVGDRDLHKSSHSRKRAPKLPAATMAQFWED